MIAKTPPPPYYAVIFTSIKTEDEHGYADMAKQMMTLASKQAGFLGVESASQNIGITISYWDSLEAIQRWKNNTEHLKAQQQGKAQWYQAYKTRIAKVERDYEFGF